MAAPAVVAFCPSPPLLHPHVGVGADEALDSLRTCCHEAVSAVLKVGPTAVVVLGSTGATADETASGSFAPWGVDVRVGSGVEPPTLSLPHALGAWLLDEAGWQGPRRYVVPGSDLGSVREEDVWGLLVIADGSNTRSAKAPGAFNPEGELFDAAVAAAIGSGDPSTLEALRAPEGIDAQGVPAWRDVARLAAGRTYTANLMATLAPFGVGYLVATWA